MKRIVLNLTAVITAFAVVSSCTQAQLESTLNDNENGAEDVTKPGLDDGAELATVTFSVGAPEVKTTVDESGIVSWTEGDVIGIYYISNGEVKTTSATALESGTIQREQVS